jgi:hypothetical protein
MQIAIAIPNKNRNEPMTARSQPMNSGWCSFGWFCGAVARDKYENDSDCGVNQRKTRKERSQTGHDRLSIVAGGAVKFFVNVKMRGRKARIDFELSPSAERKIRNYVWVAGRTGSNLAGRWVERERR